MQNKIVFGIMILFLSAMACKSPKEKALSKIKKTESQLFDKTTVEIDKTLAMEAILLYEDYAKNFSDDSLIPLYLFKTAGLYSSIEKYEEAIATYKQVYQNYPDYEKAPQCLFLQGFIFDDKLKDIVSARSVYQVFLTKYPDDKLAESTRFLMYNLGKSDEDIIKELEAMQEAQE